MLGRWWLLTTLCATLGAAAAPWEKVVGIADFDQFDLSPADAVYAVRKAGELKCEGTSLNGRVSVRVEVPETGWYELSADPNGGLNDFQIDTQPPLQAGERPKAGGERFGKVGNVWLTQGAHTIAVQRRIWWGFWPPLKAIQVRRAGSALGQNLGVAFAHGWGDAVVRRGESLGLTITVAGRQQTGRLRLALRAADNTLGTPVDVTLPAVAEPLRLQAKVPCPTEGRFQLLYLDGDQPIPAYDLPPLAVQVLDTRRVARPGGELRRTLVGEVDCAAKAPDYEQSGASTLVEQAGLRYRQSGEVGFLSAQHKGEAESWFAYTLATPEVGRPYQVEIDYPDDAYRTFLIVLREASTEDYPVAGGVDSGGSWACTGAMQTQSLLFWPRTAAPRIVFMPAHNGLRAAAAKVRVYRVDGEIPPLDVPDNGRLFANWYEEGSNFAGFYGGKKGGVVDAVRSADNWAREVAYMGGNLLMPTAAVYQMSLYPSAYNRQFAEPTTPDVLRVLALTCEKYGLRLVPELHPECRELGDPDYAGPAGDNVLISKTGARSGYAAHGPMFHPLHPANRAWYLGLVGEMAARYADSPAFAGVSLRQMSWANPSLLNFHSLDWGYDDLAIGLFEREAQVDVPVPPRAADRYTKRYDWLMANARARWIDWRCAKVAELYAALVAQVRTVRPDLKLFSTLFDADREAGLDMARLAQIDGLVLINARHAYGRRQRTYAGHLADPEMREELTGSARLTSVPGGAFLFGAGYFEATEKVLKPVSIGLPADTKEKWISGVVNPAGRAYLERYALAMADGDAVLLGDGGNAYTLGQPLLREFLAEYRRLPAERFVPRPDARDPVAVWELARPGDSLFYCVNRESYPVEVALTLAGAGPVRRLVGGAALPVDGGRAKLTVPPFGLLACTAPAGTRLARVETTVPAAERARVAAMAEPLLRLTGLSDAGRRGLDAALAEYRTCLAEGRLWRARTLWETADLARDVYEPTKVYPVGLEYLKP
ncbi:MAG: hypothetical protein HZB16_08530 [Armatimonadetes bacterium]|nr:hypothetical protein [Armatimonadota bacterium]